MHEISIFLKNKLLITQEEYRILDKYSSPGKIWSIIHKPDLYTSYIIREKSLEYILDKETLFLLKLISQNILAYWDTNITRNLKDNEEYNIRDSLFICRA